MDGAAKGIEVGPIQVTVGNNDDCTVLGIKVMKADGNEASKERAAVEFDEGTAVGTKKNFSLDGTIVGLKIEVAVVGRVVVGLLLGAVGVAEINCNEGVNDGKLIGTRLDTTVIEGFGESGFDSTTVGLADLERGGIVGDHVARSSVGRYVG